MMNQLSKLSTRKVTLPLEVAGTARATRATIDSKATKRNIKVGMGTKDTKNEMKIPIKVTI